MKLGIQRHRYPGNPKKAWIFVFDVESGRVDTKDFILVVIYLFIGVKRTSRQVTLGRES